jgi:tetratricopeptide (TPR) repeat protein
MSKVFISYRRADSAVWTGKLYRHLSLRYGKDLIFLDVEDIKPGNIWLETILKEIESCQVILVIIGSYWLTDPNGVRRLEDSEDILYKEIQRALLGNGIIIPVLVGSAEFPSSVDLPEPIRPLTERQAFQIREKRWTTDIKALIDKLKDMILPYDGNITLNSAQQEIYEMQEHYFYLLNNKSAADALEQAQKMQTYMDHFLPLFPQDPYLKVTRGYLFKNKAMALLRLFNRDKEADVALIHAESIFHTMLDENSNDAGAWNGLGSVEAVRGNFEASHKYIDKALKLIPDYPEAIFDHREVLKRLGLKRCSVIK